MNWDLKNMNNNDIKELLDFVSNDDNINALKANAKAELENRKPKKKENLAGRYFKVMDEVTNTYKYYKVNGVNTEDDDEFNVQVVYTNEHKTDNMHSRYSYISDEVVTRDFLMSGKEITKEDYNVQYNRTDLRLNFDIFTYSPFDVFGRLLNMNF